MKSLYTTFKQSWYSRSFYASLADGSLWHALRYFGTFSLFVGALFWGILLAIMLMQLNPILDTVIKTFPADVVISIIDGKAYANTSVVSPVRWPDAYIHEDGYEWVTVIAVEGEQDITRLFQEYRTLSVLTHDTFAMRNFGDGTITLYPLADAEDAEFTLESVTNWIQEHENTIRLASIGIVALLIILSPFVGIILVALSALFGFVLVVLVAGMRGISLSAKQKYLSAMYALTPAYTLSVVGFFAGISVPLQVMALVYLITLIVCIRKEITPPVVLGE